jgi:hypothetical protein
MAVMMRRNSTSFASMLSFDFMDGEGLSQKSDTSLAPLPLRRDSSLQQQSVLLRGASDNFDFICDMELPEFGSAGAGMPNGPEFDLFAAADFAGSQQAPLLQQYKGTLSRGTSGDFMAAVQAASQYHQQQHQYTQVVKEEPMPSPPRLSNLRANSADGETAAAPAAARRPAAARAPTKKRARSWSNAAAAAPPAARAAPRRAAAAAAVVKFEAATVPAGASASEEDAEEEEEEEEIDESLSADQRELRHKRARNRLHAKVSVHLQYQYDNSINGLSTRSTPSRTAAASVSSVGELPSSFSCLSDALRLQQYTQYTASALTLTLPLYTHCTFTHTHALAHSTEVPQAQGDRYGRPGSPAAAAAPREPRPAPAHPHSLA